jgi:hypothetical protein
VWKERIVDVFEALSQQFSGGAEENYEASWSGYTGSNLGIPEIQSRGTTLPTPVFVAYRSAGTRFM